MTLQDIFDQLEHGELSQLKVGELADLEHQKKIVSHINLALLDLHKRFWLRYKRIVLELDEDIREYSLRNLYKKDSTQTKNNFFFDDKYTEFEEDVLKIERVLDKNEKELPLNDEITDQINNNKKQINYDQKRNGVIDSFYTPFFNVLRVPESFKDDFVYVEYKAGHPRIYVDENTNPCNINIDVSPAFLDPLLLFVAHREFRGLNTDQKQESTDYMNLYELSCKRIEHLGYEIRPNRTNARLDDNGWV